MIRQEGHIGLYEGIILVFAVLSAMIFLHYPEFLIQGAGPAAWQAALVMTAAAMLLFVPVSALAARFPGQGLAEISEATAGPLVGSLISLGVAAWFGTSVVVTLRSFIETFITAILPTTPPSVLIVVVMACAVYASYRGLEPLSRTAQIVFPLITLGLVLLLIFDLPLANVSFLYPFWGHGLGATVSTGLYYTGMASEALVLLAVGYAFRSGSLLRASGLLGILLFGIALTLTVLVLVVTFGSVDAEQVPFPLFNLARMVHLGRFLERPESLLVMFWFFAAVVRLGALFHGTVVTLSGTMRLPFYRPIVFPVAVIMVALSLLPEDSVVVLRLERDWLRASALLIMAVPVALLLLAYVRGLRGGHDHAA